MGIHITKITWSNFYHGNPYDGKMASLYWNWDHLVLAKSQQFLKAQEP